jgi:hypothetical protein
VTLVKSYHIEQITIAILRISNSKLLPLVIVSIITNIIKLDVFVSFSLFSLTVHLTNSIICKTVTFIGQSGNSSWCVLGLKTKDLVGSWLIGPL